MAIAKGIGDVIYSLLSNNAPVAAIVGTKIYPYLAVDDLAYPYIVYTIEGNDAEQNNDGICTDIVSVNIECYSETLGEVEDIGNKCRTALDRVSGTTETIKVQSISFRNEDGGYADEDRVFIKIQNYSFRIEK